MCIRRETMITKRLLTLAVLLPFLAMSTMAYAGAKVSAPVKGQKYDTAGGPWTPPRKIATTLSTATTVDRNTLTDPFRALDEGAVPLTKWHGVLVRLRVQRHRPSSRRFRLGLAAPAE